MHLGYTGGYAPGDVMGGFDVIGEAPRTHATSPTSEGGGSTEEAMIEGETRMQTFEDTSGEPDGGGGLVDQLSAAARGLTGGILSAATGLLSGTSQAASGQTAFLVVTIRDVQRALNVLGFGPLGEDDLLGPMTKAAVKRYQSARGLQIDGSPGPATKDRLTKDLAARAGSLRPGLASNLPSIFGPPGLPNTIPTPFGPIPNPFGGPTPALPPPPPRPAPLAPSSSGLIFGLPTSLVVGGAIVGVGVLIAAGYVLGGPKKKSRRREAR